ncbi:AAA family ATPase [Streptomyces sp. DH10]|uniref:AAA family ATPase n=1 Tax=Streptomyces sp. DH10 TaxID=3040121 RepID=UPI003FA7E63D
MPAPLSLPDGPFLLALIGAAGSGKSRVARAFPPDWRLELDNYRWQATGSPGDQTANPIASVVFRELLDARLTRNLPVLADSTNSERVVRAYLLQRARHWRMTTVAIVFRSRWRNAWPGRRHARRPSRCRPTPSPARRPACPPPTS